MKGIYRIRHIETGRSYVGSSVDIERRWREHIWLIRRNLHRAKHLMHAFQKYGADAFAFEVLEEMPAFNDETRLERENHWIQVLKPAFNVAPVAGSTLGMKHSAKTIENMRKSRTPEVLAAISAAQSGRIKSAEEIAKMKASLKGRISPRKGVKLSDETKAKISKNRAGIARSPEAIAITALKNTGRKRTDEMRARMSAAQTGRTFSAETKEKMSRARIAYCERTAVQ